MLEKKEFPEEQQLTMKIQKNCEKYGQLLKILQGENTSIYNNVVNNNFQDSHYFSILNRILIINSL